LVGQADRQLKRLQDSGETAFVEAPPVELLNSLLYYAARAKIENERLLSIRSTYGLGEIDSEEEQLASAREGLAGPSAKLMQAVAEAIKEDLGSVKDVLDIFVRTGMENIKDLEPQLDMLKKISDTLGVLGLKEASDAIQAQTQSLKSIVDSNSTPETAVLEQVAATMLDVEDALDTELVKSALPGEGESESGDSAATQLRQATASVVGECIVNLARIKEAIVALVNHPGDVRVLDQVGPQLKGITAGLMMLGKTRAVGVAERIGEIVSSRLAPGVEPLSAMLTERLADSVVSLEYYLETISAARRDPWYMLENAERCLDLLDSASRVPDEEELSARVEALEAEADSDAPSTATITRHPAVMKSETDRPDPELVEIFIEEAKEEILGIRRHLPVWRENRDDFDALVAARRSFHTLKGSGRMVGAEVIAEFAWSVENLLNRIINQTLESNDEIVEYLERAVDLLPELVEQLEVGTEPSADADALTQEASALAEGSPTQMFEAIAPEDSAFVKVVPQEPDTGEADTDASQMDPVLADIFVKEMRGHLVTIRESVETIESSSAPAVVEEPLFRASHTLLGSANMAGFEPAIVLTEPLATYLARLFETEGRLEEEGLAALTETADTLERMADSLSAKEEFSDDTVALVERLQALVSAQPPEAEDTQPPPVAEKVDFDPEIAAIFADEAAELLESAELALEDLQSDEPSPDRFVELQRLLHTLKGGARMAGISAMGDLSHSLEDLVTWLSDSGDAATEGVVDLVQRSLDELHRMRDSVSAGQHVADLPDILEEIRGVVGGGEASAEPVLEDDQTDASPTLFAVPDSPDRAEEEVVDESLEEQDEDVVEESDAETAEAITEETTEAVAGEHVEDAPEESFLEAVAEDSTAGAVDELPDEISDEEQLDVVAEDERAEEPDRVVESEPAQQLSSGQELVRVDADLLDSLLNGAGEISIFQSRLNQQAHSFDFSLRELGQTVVRLREQLRNLEAETEAEILHRHQQDAEEDEDFDPLELDRYSNIQQLSRALAETASDVASINDLLRDLSNETDTLLTQQARVTTEVQDGLMQTRMVPFQRHVPRLARIVRQAAAEAGKSAELIVEGASGELDRQVLECMLPAFEHLLRNAVVHGLESPQKRRESDKDESGQVTLKLKREGSEVLVEVSDDGSGLDLDAIRRKAREQGLLSEGEDISDVEAAELILVPGLTTAGELTQTAGRGVGMDVVNNEIKNLGGSMRIETTPGAGTRFLIRLPYTLAITNALIVKVGEETFALPLPTVEGVTRVPKDSLLQMLTEDDPTVDYGGIQYRIQHLGTYVGAAPSALPEDDSSVALILVRAGDNSAALLTDSLEGSREVVVKTLGSQIASVRGVSGATILGDGRIIVILDMGTLVRSQADFDSAQRAPEPDVIDEQITALVVDDSITMRRVTQRLLERHGVRVLTARDGLDAISVMQDHDPDIILLDIEMPRMDGYQFATHVRNDAKHKDVPIIMITSRTGEKHRARAIEIGVNDYLGKPYQEGQLTKAIENLLERSL
jgi:chemosensory pili system protein ChpA (sensor histidine kinase/response regulator)